MTIILLKVAEVRRETEDTVTVCLKQPGLKKVKYLAGQYVSLVFRINGRRYIRPYSLSSAPGIDANLEIPIKRVSGDVVSNHINDKVNVGDMIEVVMPVMGDFIFEKELFQIYRHIILRGVGNGLTPLISIAKYVLAMVLAIKLL